MNQKERNNYKYNLANHRNFQESCHRKCTTILYVINSTYWKIRNVNMRSIYSSGWSCCCCFYFLCFGSVWYITFYIFVVVVFILNILDCVKYYDGNYYGFIYMQNEPNWIPPKMDEKRQRLYYACVILYWSVCIALKIE